MEPVLDPLACYELCVQSPRHVAAFLRAVHGNEPIVLREDFCGTAALSRYWCREAARQGVDGRAIGVDLDAEALRRAGEFAGAEGVMDRLRLVQGDALDEAVGGPGQGCDVVFVGNFSIGYIHTRAALVKYLAASRRRLLGGHGGFGGGVMVCDTYGGASAFKLGGMTRMHRGRGGEMIRYHWVHEAADPLTAMVTNTISFQVVRDGEVVAEWPRAFVYRWRLWSIAEIREAMAEAGYAASEVYTDVNIAPGQPARPVRDGQDLGDDWIVLVAGRA